MKFCQYLIILLATVCLSDACAPAGNRNEASPASVDSIKYAKGFSISNYDDYSIVDVKDPWDSTRLLQRYILIEREKEIPSSLPQGTIVRIPLQNVAVYTSVHASIIEQLKATDKIIGVCEPRYIDIPVLQERLKNGTLADFGDATSPNVEKMIERNVEAVIASPFQNGSYGAVEKLGIPIIEGADYMEETPLGRAEWIRFYGMLFSKSQTADSIFAETEQRYNALKALIPDSIYRPTVFSDKKYGASWFVSRGGSLIATAYKDAGADYVFSELDGSGSTPLSFEAVFDKCIHADFWLIKCNQPEEMTYESLSSEYTPYSNFDAFKNKNIYVCNTGEVPYYEEYPLHPDWLLEDLIRVFHPEILPGAPVRYFQKMEK